MYVVEIQGGQIVGKYSKSEAYDVARSYRDKFGVHVHVYPEEPETKEYSTCPCCGWTLKDGQCDACGQGVKQPGPQPKQMCEYCEYNTAMEGEFLCEECLLRMAKDYE